MLCHMLYIANIIFVLIGDILCKTTILWQLYLVHQVILVHRSCTYINNKFF